MAQKSETIRARVEPSVKKAAESVFAKLGISTTDAITLFYKQVALHKGIPFELKIPNAETQAAMREAEQGLKGRKRYANAKALFDDLLR